MDDIRDISNSTGNTQQSTGNTQQNTGSQPNMYGQYGQYGQYGYGQRTQYGSYGQRPDPLEDNHPVIPVKEKKKITLPVIILVVVVLTVFAVMMITLGPAYSAARKYGKALADGNDPEKISEMIYPEDYLKSSGVDYDTYTSSMSSVLSTLQCMGDIKFKGVTIGKKIKSGDLDDIEKYYNFIFSNSGYNKNVSLEKGYEIKLKFKVDGSNSPYECCVVKMKGEGWKIFPIEINELTTIMSTIKMIEDMGLQY